MAIFIGVVGTAAGFVMAFSSLSDAQGYAALFSWLFLSIASLLLILPLYSIGNLVEEMAELRDKTRILSDKLSNISRSVSSEAPADKFSPSGRIKIQKLPQTPMRPQTSPSISVQTTTSPQADDFTRSLSSKTIADEKDAVKSSPYDTSTMPISQSIEPSPTLRNAFRTATGEQSTSKMFFTTSGIDTYAINRANNSVTKILPNRTTTISAGGLHSVFIYSNGRASAIGYGTYSQCSVADWANLISVAAGNHHTVGLRSDGSCVATGYNGYGQCNVQQWSNICAISAGFGHTVGLLENGTCTATGDNAYGQCNVFDWVDIVSIVA
ncbi:MAG: hypothetical protein KBS59_04585, partial [Clostridiales bacterium]|nr:hypothetical protein [Clostridiales bacterium]